MAFTEYRLVFNGQPAGDERLAQIAEIRVDQAIDMVTEAQIILPIGRDEGGEWPEVLEDDFAPLTRIRVEVAIEGSSFTPLIDGQVVAQRFEMAGGPNESQAVIVVHDDSAMMNRAEQTRLWEDMAPEDIAAQIFSEYGLAAEVEASGIGAPSLERVVTQSGTDYALLRKLARQANMVVSVEANAGGSIGRFRHLPTASDGLPELLITGTDRNVNKLVLELDALAPVAASSQMIDHATLATLTAESTEPSTETLGDTPTGDVSDPAKILSSHFAADPAELAAGVQAAVDRGAWAYSGEGEVDAQIYPAVLSPYRRIAVAGAGSRLSGDYLISEVSHHLTDQGYKQSFVLRRNAQSGGGGGGLLGGVF
ncbi:MAG: contractile injection system protein, VgrG/Pvc8 family [Pseudomonadota bacterium]